jgi:hypothetical protein
MGKNAAIAALIMAVSIQPSSRATAQTSPAMSAEDHTKAMHHGAMAMGFSQTDTTHHFLLKKDGGVIEVEANSPQDKSSRDLISTHLAIRSPTTIPGFQVYDPPVCCSTGVCGPQVDPVLPRFTEDFYWLANQGIAVERFNLSQQPQSFVANDEVREALANDGTSCLPLILVNGGVVSKGRYPEREELIRLVGIQAAAGPRPLPVIAGDCRPGAGCCS